ncbi:MAG: DUF3109 family protein [Syntrophothermus sp.]
MIIIDDTIVSEEIRDVLFCCDLTKCKGACCIDGDGGAPLEEEEISFLEDHLGEIKKFMRQEGLEEVEKTGVFDYDADGNFVTPLVSSRECVFVIFEEGIAKCAIEKAFETGTIPFRKPVSCHLYPIRISPLKHYDAVNYHKWHICRKALDLGNKNKLPLYRFLEGPLIRKYGRAWYNKLLKQVE